MLIGICYTGCNIITAYQETVQVKTIIVEHHHKPDEQHVQRAYQENPCPLDGETYILISLALLAFAGKFYY